MSALVVGAAASPFGMFTQRTLRSVASRTADGVLADAGIPSCDLERVLFANAAAGILTRQEMIRGHVALAGSSLSGRPLISVENACASSSSAFHPAEQLVAAGAHEVVAVVGAEKMTHTDRTRAHQAPATGIDVETLADGTHAGPVFMEIYASEAGALVRSGATSLGGRVPVNPSGGLLARGHPIGATGAAQLAEVVRQIRGQAGQRQVAQAQVGLAESVGGHLAGGPAVCCITVSGRQGTA